MVPHPEAPPRTARPSLCSTQTKIKNYFYGNIRLLLKIALRAFVACSTGFINDLRTEALVNIYESQEGTPRRTQSMRAWPL